MAETYIHPGFVDLHWHFRKPSNNQAEDFVTGTMAAVTSGAVAGADMPNNPGMPTWSADAIVTKLGYIERDAYCKVGVNAGSQPESDNLGELPAMAGLALMLKLYATMATGNDREYEAEDFMPAARIWHDNTPAPIAIHPGAHNLEDFIGKIAGDLGHPLHVCHVGSSEQLTVIRKAKQKELPVTSEATPHHMLMTSHETESRSWYARMQPPLAHQDETEEILHETEKDDGVIDAIATDHAPHLPDAKDQSELIDPHGNGEGKCFGLPNLEHTMAIFIRRMVNGDISEARLRQLTSTNPARILGLKLTPRTYVEWDLEKYRINEEETLQTGAGWTPYLGMLAVGRVKKTVIEGIIVAERQHNGRTIPIKSSILDSVLIKGNEV